MINEVYYAVIFFPELESKSIEMLKNAPNFVELDMEWASGFTAKLTVKGEKMFLLRPGDTLLFNQEKEFSHVLHGTGSIGIPKKNL